MLAVDQLYIEKKGFPTVTILTTPYEEVVNAKIKEYGVSEMGLAVVEHPIAGYTQEEINAKVDKDFPIILAAIEWQPK